MIRNKSIINFICSISIVTVLLVSITGRTIPVKAVGTTVAIAGTAFVLTGAVYLSYVALTQGEMVLPAAEEMHNWLGAIGRKVSQYPSGASAYQEIYQNLARDPAANVINGIWSWTIDRIKAFANDFSDTRIIDNIIGYYSDASFYTPLTNFNYNFEITVPIYEIYGTGIHLPSDYLPLSGAQFILDNGSYHTIVGTDISSPYRNVKNLQGTYGIQIYRDGEWESITSFGFGGYSASTSSYYFEVSFPPDYYFINNHGTMRTMSIQASTYPPLSNADIYDESTGEIIQVLDSTQYISPSWNDPDNNNRPIIPWVPIPDLPANVDPPAGYVNPQWGFNLQDLLDKLLDLAGAMIDVGGIAALINGFAGLHGDEYYIEYSVGDTNYYTYYQPTIFDNDTEYVTYNIDVSEQQDIIPVDLNTIQLYTNNDYLNEIKERSTKFGETLGEYFVFWHNSDPMTVYVIFGSVIVILIGAFIGKWGHS